MHTQFFGNFLLNKNIITPEQLIKALKIQASTHKKLGTLAIHSGFMSASEVEEVYITQTRVNKLFGELAIDLGYLTKEQVDSLLTAQLPDYMLLGQILVDHGILTHIALEDLITEYRSVYEIYDLELMEEQQNMVDKLLLQFHLPEDLPHPEYVVSYLKLLFNNLVRFIGEDFTTLGIMNLPEVPTNFCVAQEAEGSFSFLSALDMEEETAVTFGSRYMNEELDSFDVYARASIEDFLNLNNGLYTVNMSNDYSLELDLMPLNIYENALLETGHDFYLLPVMYSFGTLNFLLSIRKMDE